MLWETKKIPVICLIAILAFFFWWSGTKPQISTRSACVSMMFQLKGYSNYMYPYLYRCPVER